MMTVNELHKRFHKSTKVTFSSMYPGCIATTQLFRCVRGVQGVQGVQCVQCMQCVCGVCDAADTLIAVFFLQLELMNTCACLLYTV